MKTILQTIALTAILLAVALSYADMLARLNIHERATATQPTVYILRDDPARPWTPRDPLPAMPGYPAEGITAQ